MQRKYSSHKGSARIVFKPIRLNLTLRGERGKLLRWTLYAIGLIIILALTANLFRPTIQLRASAEVQRIAELGVLTVGVRNDIPQFAEDGIGFEIELARLFSEYLVPEAAEGTAIKYVSVSDKTSETKLSDGSVDAVLALMQRGAKSQYAYSYPYFTDVCNVAIQVGAESKPLDDMLIGYVQDTASERTLNSYISIHETTVEQSFIDKLLKKEIELPPDAIVFQTKAFASYPDMLLALKNGRIDGAAMAGVFVNKYRSEFDFDLHQTDLGEIEYAIAVSSDQPAIAQLADMFIYELQESGAMAELLEAYGIAD